MGKIDISVNNASGSLHVPAEEMTEKQWNKVVDLNSKVLSSVLVK